VPFAYLRDPLFLVCFAAYWLHKLLVVCGLSNDWLRAWLNDVICLPFWVPIILWAQRRLGLRTHDGPPAAIELVVPLVIFAGVFEVWLPSTRTFAGLAVPDPCDVLCYACGGLGSALFWSWRYRPRAAYVTLSR
jgi:hypothetical protein